MQCQLQWPSPTQAAQGINTKMTSYPSTINCIGYLKDPMAQSDIEIEDNIFWTINEDLTLLLIVKVQP